MMKWLVTLLCLVLFSIIYAEEGKKNPIQEAESPSETEALAGASEVSDPDGEVREYQDENADGHDSEMNDKNARRRIAPAWCRRRCIGLVGSKPCSFCENFRLFRRRSTRRRFSRRRRRSWANGRRRWSSSGRRRRW